MNAKQKLHQSKLSLWTTRFQEPAASGQTAKAWCESNSLSVHAFNYWKHVAKEAYVDSILPDIVPLPASNNPIPIPENNSYPGPSTISRDSRELREMANSNAVSISLGDIRIEIGANASDEMIAGIIKAVRHA